jgi:hypothetical protein
MGGSKGHRSFPFVPISPTHVGNAGPASGRQLRDARQAELANRPIRGVDQARLTSHRCSFDGAKRRASSGSISTRARRRQIRRAQCVSAIERPDDRAACYGELCARRRATFQGAVPRRPSFQGQLVCLDCGAAGVGALVGELALCCLGSACRTSELGLLLTIGDLDCSGAHDLLTDGTDPNWRRQWPIGAEREHDVLLCCCGWPRVIATEGADGPG